MAGPSTYPGTPGWVKAFGVIVILLLLLGFVSALAGGGPHGPGRHIGGTDTSSSREGATPSEGGHQ